MKGEGRVDEAEAEAEAEVEVEVGGAGLGGGAVGAVGTVDAAGES